MAETRSTTPLWRQAMWACWQQQLTPFVEQDDFEDDEEEEGIDLGTRH